jgi:hypothetical protein
MGDVLGNGGFSARIAMVLDSLAFIANLSLRPSSVSIAPRNGQ